MTLKINNIFFYLVTAFLISSCASTYSPLTVEEVSLSKTVEGDQISYAYDLQAFSKRVNKRYTKKEENKNLSVVAFELTNNTGDTLRPADDLVFRLNKNVLKTYNRQESFKLLKQNEIMHLLYFLIAIPAPTSLTTAQLVLKAGLGVVLANFSMIKASSANRKLKAELYEGDILTQKIPDGETARGIIVFQGRLFGDIEVSLKD